MMNTPDPQRCFFHPDTPTRLSCVECNRAICPKCMIPFEVGLICPFCARGQRRSGMPMSTSALLRISILAFGVGMGFGYLYPLFMPHGIVTLVFVCAILYVIGSAIGKWGFQAFRVLKTPGTSLFSLLPLILGMGFSPFGQMIIQQCLFLQESLSTAANVNPLNTNMTSAWFPLLDVGVVLLPVALFIRGFFRN